MEIVEAVKKERNGNKVLLNQHETSRSAVTLGDEDTESGTRLHVKALLNDTLYYSEVFTDDTLYEEANGLIQELKGLAEVELVSEEEIDQLVKK
ncbi:hypothetical protein SAMD00020551_2463 [Mesobacillus selenatarsenatis SF-1]|uniref:Uncharacterized protein n=1 Tax=Mesobacillus selenatarsenatis (strain DSM 18680 / JCM 14380 / FERM P-15431 / SF-1) TaxID=1321606 RepID=A0A0A8X4Y6_MESS1|nr:hypothetical protein SAMD00020551_2463 [Mesobacillus selenatarsenatis SF-1]